MKRFARPIAVLLLIILGLGVAWVLKSPGQPESVATGFLGFTNTGARSEAIFGLTNPPNSAVSLHSARLKNSTDAKEQAGHFSWARKEDWGLSFAVWLKTTNEPLEIVFQFQKRAAGLRRVVEVFKEITGKFTGNEQSFFTGSKFYVTNETVVNVPTSSGP